MGKAVDSVEAIEEAYEALPGEEHLIRYEHGIFRVKPRSPTSSYVSDKVER